MRRMLIGLMLGALLLGAVACASAREGAPPPTPAPAPPGAVVPPAPPAPQGGVPAPIITIPPRTTSAAVKTPSPAPAITVASVDSQPVDRMIVRTGSLVILVEDVPGTIDRIAKLAEDMKGYVVSSTSGKEGERLVGGISIRVPAEKYNEAVQGIRNMALEITSDTSSSQDVTEEYTDITSRLRNLEASEQQLLKLMEKATKIEDIIAIQRELTSVRGQIEQAKGRKLYLERTSATSLIQVKLSQAKLEVKFTVDKARPNAGETVRFMSQVAGGFAPYSYQWDFGDGDKSNIPNPSHAYSSAGTYSITLKVTDDRQNMDTETRNDYVMVVSGWSAGNTARSAWNGLAMFGRILSDVLIWVLFFSPVWIAGSAIWYWRRRVKRNRTTA